MEVVIAAVVLVAYFIYRDQKNDKKAAEKAARDERNASLPPAGEAPDDEGQG